jgi:hypothetical protein
MAAAEVQQKVDEAAVRRLLIPLHVSHGSIAGNPAVSNSHSSGQLTSLVFGRSDRVVGE